MSLDSQATPRQGDTLSWALAVLGRRWLIIVSAVVVATGVAIASQELTEDAYEASASVVFGAPSLSDAALQVDRDTADPEREAATQVLIAESEEVGAGVRASEGLRATPQQLLAAIDVEAEENANVLRITARQSDAESAARLANAFAEEYIAFKARSEVQSIRSAEEDLNRQLDALPPDAVERTDLQQSLQRLQALRAVATGDARIIGSATPPSEPAGLGRLKTGILGAIIGLAVGLSVAFLVESLDRRMTELEEFEREYRLPALSAVPPSGFAAERAEERQEQLEPYRILRSALDFAAVARDLRAIMITSAVPGEGKTTVAVDLAHAVALTGQRVRLVELDLRRPTFGQHLDIEPREGVTGALRTHAPAYELMQEPFARLPNLSVLPSGQLPPNPSELLASDALTALLDDLRREDALVILDAPPLLPVADAQILLSKTGIDAVLIVARLGFTTRDEVRRARAILDRHVLQPLGLVVTGAAGPEGYDYGGYRSREPERSAATSASTT
jgi:non-specific protein-tyrosine kinase